MTASHTSSLNAERALEILLVLGEVGPEGLSLSEISERIGGGKSAAHRSLTALLKKGFAEAAGRYGHYRLGPAVPMLARRQERLEPQIQLIRPGMTEFARRTGFTVYLMVQAGVDAVCVEMVSRSSRRQFTMGVGARVPMGVAAGSVSLLSMLPEEGATRIVEANAERYANHPSLRHVDVAIVSGQVAAARERGYAVNMGYYLPGEGGLGLPVPRRGLYEVNVAVSFNAPLELMNDIWIEATIGVLRECLGEVLTGVP
ncbi:helix-turn-helix domain-containing protein [uncultured Nitratireductor sp.]|uniref:IclR family transcriptional regulator n=1 Tax=uncultured Nitratireductor sp. TaxID=520953 RepID=UPI002609D2A3|nr:helix-turn-helix domain-containing protein [uncultured Nitratireductor sp.]